LREGDYRLEERREAAERRETRRYLWILLSTLAATAAGILAGLI
jgi:uncharacterized membrane protein YdbT with pleckstrin-like domain